MNRILLASIALALLIPGGCGSRKPASASASGKVTAGGQPVTGAVINFMNPTTHSVATATLDANGAYSVTTELPPGKYKVFVVPKSADEPPEPGKKAPPAAGANIPAKYQSQESSTLDAEIKAGSNPNLDFKLD